MKLKDILPNPNNPRKVDKDKFEKLKKSIKEFPKMLALRPMVIDENNIVLGGNMRLKALKELKYKDIPDEWVKKASELTDEEKRQFIIKDNVGFGAWDWELLGAEWDVDELGEWGLDVGGFDIDENELGEEFTLPDGDREPFQQMTFTLADVQAETIKEALQAAKENNIADSFGNENGNGNALYRIITEWAELKI